MRSSDIKNLGLGLGIGALFASLFFIIFFVLIPPAKLIQASSLPEINNASITTSTLILLPTPTLTVTSAPLVFSATPTSTSLPVATATQTIIESMLANGGIAFAGPLTPEQQIKLYETSLKFIAPTYEQAKKMSVLVNHVRFSDPNNTCGPLSIAILQSAGMIDQDFIAHDFFLINPDVKADREIINSAFPKNLYSDTRYKIRIDKFDWVTNPLAPGDFLYIYAGTGGNFEHMLVVNRVDAQGRAYSVTNYNTAQGFVINEVMLYDPADPNTGMFAKWTEKQFALLGSTGYAGFEVWRLIQ